MGPEAVGALLVAPRRKLPEDLIREIVPLCVPGNLRLPSVDGKNDPRLQITQISSDWRSVAFSIPSLWAIKIITPSDASISLAEAWLRQSSGAVTLSIPRLPSTPHFNLMLKDLIEPNISRLKTLGPLKVDTLQWNQISSLHFDSLTKLHLLSEFVTGIQPPNALVHAPALREVLLGHLSTPDNNLLHFPKLPWAQLTSLALQGDLIAPDLFAFLPQCPSLERCEIETVIDLFGPPLPPGLSLHFPHLKSLSIIIAPSPPSLFDVFLLTTFPQLTWLEINILPDTKASLRRFIEHIRSIANTLHYFEISERPDRRAIFEEDVLSEMPMLGHLVLSPSYFLSSATLGKIRTKELLPHMHHLQFSVADGVQEALSMLEARQPQLPFTVGCPSGLERVVIYVHGAKWGNEIQGRLDALRSNGMNVQIILPM